MAKEKIFSPEDFDKPIDKSWWQKYRGIILSIAGALIVVAIILCVIFLKDVDKKEVITLQESTENPQAEKSLEKNLSSDTETLESQEAEKSEFGLETNNTEIVAENLNPVVNSEEKEAQNTIGNAKVSNNVETEALNVIHGDYGNGELRKNKLGSSYQTIQNRVNELKRQGAF